MQHPRARQIALVPVNFSQVMYCHTRGWMFGTSHPSDEEDALIKAGIAADQDTHELSDIELKQLRTMRGRPLGSGKKVQLTIRFDADVILAFKQAGDGWQTKMNDALREWLAG